MIIMQDKGIEIVQTLYFLFLMVSSFTVQSYTLCYKIYNKVILHKIMSINIFT